MIRSSSQFGTERVDHLCIDPHLDSGSMYLHYGSLGDGNALSWLLQDIEPDEVYSLWAQSHLAVSFQNPTSRPDGQPHRMLDTSRARELSGFEASTPLEEGLKETIAWWETQAQEEQA